MSLLAASPWVYFAMKEAYLRPEDKEESRQRTELVFGLLTLTGIFCIIVWAFNEPSFLARDVFQLLFDGVGRICMTNVLATDGLIHLSATNRKVEKESGTETIARVDAAFLLSARQSTRKMQGDLKRHGKRRLECTTCFVSVSWTWTPISRRQRKVRRNPRRKVKCRKAEIGMHDVFRDSVTDVKDHDDSPTRKREAKPETEAKEIKHEVIDLDLETCAPDEDRDDPERLMRMMDKKVGEELDT